MNLPNDPTLLAQLIPLLGIDREEILDRLVDRMINLILEGNGIHGFTEGLFKSRFEAILERQVDYHLQQTYEKPLQEFLKDFVIQPTNAYGESRGEKRTFTEAVISFGKEWLFEKVDTSGRKASSQGIARITHLIHSNIREMLFEAVKPLITEMNEHIAEGLSAIVTEVTQKITRDIRATLHNK